MNARRMAKRIVGMWQARLRDNYDGDFGQWQDYSDTYGLAERLGFGSAKEAWEANPMVQGSTDPSDFRVVGSALAADGAGDTKDHLMALLDWAITSGDVSGNPYAKPAVKGALKHLAELEGIEDWLDALEIAKKRKSFAAGETGIPYKIHPAWAKESPDDPEAINVRSMDDDERGLAAWEADAQAAEGAGNKSLARRIRKKIEDHRRELGR